MEDGNNHKNIASCRQMFGVTQLLSMGAEGYYDMQQVFVTDIQDEGRGRGLWLVPVGL